MYCPKCAVQNGDEAKFCRSCGADISLVPDAVNGQLSERLAAAEAGDFRSRVLEHDRGKGPPSIDRAVRAFFTGLAFLFVAFAVRSYAPAGNVWWFWMFIPAFAGFGDAVATYLRVKEDRRKLAQPSFVPAQASIPAARVGELSAPRATSEMVTPPSVTEGTTRHLGVPVERRPKDL
jgi:hypothetical protein